MAASATSTCSSETKQMIYDRFHIPSLTEEQNCAIQNIKDGKDVFLCLRTGGGKSLAYESYPVIFPMKSVIVIAPLVSIMDEQCKKLNSLGFKATYIGFDHSEDGHIVSGAYDFVFASPEQLLGTGRFREMLKLDVYQEKLGLIVVDEAHTVIHWGEGSKHEDPFREWFSKLGELRSLCPKAQMVALTATAGPTQRRKILKSLCFNTNCKIIHDSADRPNIKISSKCIPNNEDPDKTFKWLFLELHELGKHLPRHVIFCESISDVSKVYTAFTCEFGNTSLSYNMYHSKTNEKVKETIRNDMSSDGIIRVLICTNAAGMGVNFKGVHNVIHYGLPRQMDSFVQQMGRAGRDGEFSQEIIIFKSHKGHLSKVESDLVKLAKDTETCRHQILCSAYLSNKSHIQPLHNCCDVCESLCDCKTDICPNKHKVFLEPEECESEEEMVRPVSDSEKTLLRHKLNSLKYSLTDQAGLSIMDVAFIHGLTNNVVDGIVNKSSMLFTADDIMKSFPIWSYETAQQILDIICEVFGDTEMYNLSESDSS